MAKLTIEVVTGERAVFTESDVDAVTVPGSEGQLGILPNHAPLISTLAGGELRVRKGNAEHSIVVFGGFVEVTPHKVVVLADSAERLEEIDVARAEAARRRAEDTLRNTTNVIELAQAEAALRRATIRLRLSQAKRQARQA